MAVHKVVAESPALAAMSRAQSAAPGEPAFVKEGDKVKKGQTVGIIEAMKLMNEIEVCVGPCAVARLKLGTRFRCNTCALVRVSARCLFGIGF